MTLEVLQASVPTAPSYLFGPQLTGSGIRFRLWAPKADHVRLAVEGEAATRTMARSDDGWHDILVEDLEPGARYRFIMPDGLHVPDPASRFQPDDVHGPSEVIDPESFAWSDSDWYGRPWTEAVIYELHVGTFTPDGTFKAAIDKLDHLADLGITAIELMPIADFPGSRNWGYDGVLLYAPDGAYGRPDDLKALVAAAHARGIMVFLDVVYNHFGPDGNYLPTYAPVFTEKHKTPWGAGVNYDDVGGDMIREFIVQNAIYWIRDFHLDGLRLDAVHAIVDSSETNILDELAARIRAAAPERHVHLILENEENEADRLEREPDGLPRTFTAQWNDDLHHVLHTAVTGERAGYYGEYAGDRDKLGRAIAEGFVFQGEVMGYRGEARGQPSGRLPPPAFVGFLQNHDQVGNRAFGDRITATAPKQAVRAAAAVYLLAPQIPMLFMGEEWAAAQPFPFFCDFEADLAKAVRDGRRQEFARFPEFQDPEARERIPDPTDAKTFQSAKLDWAATQEAAGLDWLEWYKAILAVRKSTITPRLDQFRSGGTYASLGDSAVEVVWTLSGGGILKLAANLDPNGPPAALDRAGGQVIWMEGSVAAGLLQPSSAVWTFSPA